MFGITAESDTGNNRAAVHIHHIGIAQQFFELPERYPHLPSEVWHAIACHTSAAEDMGPLDMVLFVADGIEPLRRASAGIQKTRDMVGHYNLEDVFWNAFVGGIVYVLETDRYLYPRTIDIYNSLAQSRTQRRKLLGKGA